MKCLDIFFIRMVVSFYTRDIAEVSATAGVHPRQHYPKIPQVLFPPGCHGSPIHQAIDGKGIQVVCQIK